MSSFELVTYNQPRAFITESFRTLRANLQFFEVGDSLKAILLAGGGFGEGTSFMTANLGVVFAQTGQKVIVVDCDLRKPQQHLIFNVDNNSGLTNILLEFKEPEDVIKDLPIAGLKILTAGPPSANPTELLGKNKMRQLIASLKEKADVILLDAPPLAVVADAAVLSKAVDGVLMVVRAMVASHDSVVRTKEMLTNARARILGVALNCARMNEAVENYQSHYANKEKIIKKETEIKKKAPVKK
ncbi:CpsD/CapB family tyrosine-protein kinase [Pelotomaculum isophthalicicum JI]|uniref:CpsD/CapB family tyrosine-protein kinase n=1 Tax=Pelotomaculum isophthalicicum JI TaxID=947010 RepID=A0A9X4H386_9FIRM|nr:CpsD/CapB family tyrosine-protein kinase [Pelotomaculum isophthalicicum]MDF9407848.1 CpsD/CapB family tyrosine-protein kinase [Pelotomaculum isophthalicicum JI]